MTSLKDVQTQKGLANFLQKSKKSESLLLKYPEITLTVNETSTVAKIIKNRYQKNKFNKFISRISEDLVRDDKIKSSKIDMILDLCEEVFRDRNRWLFSSSKKAMKRVMSNAKS